MTPVLHLPVFDDDDQWAGCQQLGGSQQRLAPGLDLNHSLPVGTLLPTKQCLEMTSGRRDMNLLELYIAIDVR